MYTLDILAKLFFYAQLLTTPGSWVVVEATTYQFAVKLLIGIILIAKPQIQYLNLWFGCFYLNTRQSAFHPKVLIAFSLESVISLSATL